MRMRLRPCLLVVVAALSAGACSSKPSDGPPVAAATVSVAQSAAPVGSPVEITYKFVVAAGARFDQDYRVMLHVLDADEALMWTDDHNPPVPTTQWKAGQTVEYTRTAFVPPYPFVGRAALRVGLYSPTTQKRLVLSGTDAGQHGYDAGTLQIRPQTESIFVTYRDGWHAVENGGVAGAAEWRWTMKRGTLVFKNPQIGRAHV